MTHYSVLRLLSVSLATALCLTSAVDAQTIETIAGNGSQNFTGEGGPALDAAIGFPTAVLAVPGTSAYYFSTDGTVHRVDDQGRVTMIAGEAGEYGSTHGYRGDGGPAIDALFSSITSLALHPFDGDLYLVDQDNARVRRIDGNGIVTTVAGTGLNLFSADPGPATERPLRLPKAISFGADGTLYVSDHSSIRKIGPDGIMHRIAGDGTVGFSGDGGPAINAKLSAPDGLVAGLDGNLYIADRGNGRLRMIDAEGIITTIGAFKPTRLAVDIHGNLYYGRSDIARIERYLPHVQATEPVAGNGSFGFAGDGGPALDAQISAWASPALSESGDVYIADYMNNRIRRVSSLDAELPRANFDGAHIDEGDSGITIAPVVVRLESPAIVPVELQVTTLDSTATADHDYQAMQAEPFVIPVGETEITIEIQVNGDTYVEGYESFDVQIDLISGAVVSSGGYRGSVVVAIQDDDQPGTQAFFLRDDIDIVPENASPHIALVTHNDSIEMQPDGSLGILVPPTHGTASFNYGYLWYTPQADWTGEDTLTYQACETAGRCLSATVRLLVRPLDDQFISADGHTGRERLRITDLRAMPGARFLATPLVAPRELPFTLGVDTTPESPWDSNQGVAWQLQTLAAAPDGQARRVRVMAMDGTQFSFNSTLYMGLDTNGDGLPSEDEVRCIQMELERRCELEILQAAGQPVRYWVMLQSRNPEPQQAEVDVFEIPMVPTDGSFAATAPGQLPDGQDFDLTVVWEDATFLSGQLRAGFIRVLADDSTDMGEFLVLLSNDSLSQRPVRLVPGETRRVALAPGGENKRIYFDVPMGTTRVSLASQSDANVDMYLVPVPLPGGSATQVAPVPEPYTPVAAGEGPDGAESLVVTSGLLQPARWYAVVANRDDEITEVALTLEIEATAPEVRSGSYFNDDRSGHGLFVYPAGNMWAGLWYTYRENGSPTWYYLQAPAPGANGAWNAPIYRAAWHGSANHLVEVGSATMTPTGPDAFQFSYNIDGLEGSEAMAALGRGCPNLGGASQDLSSHWFDPAHAGTGYSVQMLPNYEFMAAFVYDALGEPRFLVAEKPGFGDADDVLDVEQLGGVCPSCTYYGRPSRTTVGTLRRVLANGTLQSIELDAIFTTGPLNTPVPGAWSSVDVVVPLGGPGTTQGCAP